MHSLTVLRDLYSHMEWGDSTIWAIISENHEAASAEKALHERMFHIHYTQHVFMKAWQGDEFKYVKSDAYPTLQTVRELAQSYYVELHDFLGTLKDDDLEKPMPLPWAKFMSRQLGKEVEVTSLGETLFQVTSHSVHHRAQVNLQLRDLGAQPPLIDYIVWVWMGRPAPTWQG